jgi:hypothetical protein
VNFYAYTKEVAMFRRLVEPAPPGNFWWVYSLGGIQDADLNPDVDRVADVFPTEEAIDAAGWHSQTESDLLAVTGPALVGIPANNIPRFRCLQGNRTFGQWQAQTQRCACGKRGKDDQRRTVRTADRSRTSREPANGRCAHRANQRRLQPSERAIGACSHTAPVLDTGPHARTGTTGNCGGTEAER